MAECNELEFELPGFSGRKIEGNFEGGNVSSDGGLVLLGQVDRWIGLTKTLAQQLPDRRDADKIEHSLESMLRQRIYGLALGYEDLNDHDFLRKDLLWQTASERTEQLASCSTLCRLENRAGRTEAWLIHQILFDQFVGSFQSAPAELTLDLDCTDDRVHGLQEGRHFHGYYYDFCFLPLYVFCGEQLLVSYLRESNIDSAKHAWAILALLVKGLRQRWPKVKITVRADSGFCRWKMLRWCERVGVNYIVGLAKNERLHALSAKWQKRAERKYQRSGEKVRLFTQFKYKAQSWDRKRRIIAKAEHSIKGANPRYVLTNLEGQAQALYDEIYCARGEMENRIKEQQLGLFSDRTSCHAWWANQFRLLLSSLAYVLLEALRRLGLSGTELARAQGWNHSLAPTENRRGHHPKHPTHSIVVEFQLSTARTLSLLLGSLLRLSLMSGADPGTSKTMVASVGCLLMPLLRHLLVRFSTKHFAIDSSRIPPQHKPSSDAKSGLVCCPGNNFNKK